MKPARRYYPTQAPYHSLLYTLFGWSYNQVEPLVLRVLHGAEV